jgi:hypothetical protein
MSSSGGKAQNVIFAGDVVADRQQLESCRRSEAQIDRVPFDNS